MRIVFAGTPEVAVPALRALLAAGHEVLSVVTREDAPLGRKRVLTPSPVASAAAELGLPIIRANALGAEVTEAIAALEPDLGVVVAYGGLIREPLLSLPAHGWINLHFSDLPRWRGAAPVQRALMAGEQDLGVTVFRLVPALDAGDILTRDSFSVPAGTSAGDALSMLSEAGTASLLSAVAGLESGALTGEPQVGESTYAHKLDRNDGRLDPSLPAAQILAHWAGVTPEPGATLDTDGVSLKVLTLSPAFGESPDPGVVSLLNGAAVLGTVDGAGLVLTRVQPAGKPAMDGAAWLRGRGGRVVVA